MDGLGGLDDDVFAGRDTAACGAVITYLVVELDGDKHGAVPVSCQKSKKPDVVAGLPVREALLLPPCYSQGNMGASGYTLFGQKCRSLLPCFTAKRQKKAVR